MISFINDITLSLLLIVLVELQTQTSNNSACVISKRGRTGICVCEGIMKKELFVEILEGTHLTFINNVFLDGHKFIHAGQ